MEVQLLQKFVFFLGPGTNFVLSSKTKAGKTNTLFARYRWGLSIGRAQYAIAQKLIQAEGRFQLDAIEDMAIKDKFGRGLVNSTGAWIMR